MTTTPRTRLPYSIWRLQVNACVQRLTGLSIDDLPDYCDRDDYEDGRSPIATARAVVRAAQD